MSDGRIRVLIVDDSAIVRKTLSDALGAEPDIEVVGTAPDPYIARDKILSLRPRVVTLDIEMPRMDGLTFLRKLMRHHPLPVIVISSLGAGSCEIALEALSSGAVEFLPKPGGPYSVGELRRVLAEKIRAAAAARLVPPAGTRPVAPPPAEPTRPGRPARLIAIGASTGGTEAIHTVLKELAEDSPPILIAQHIPPVFSRTFAERLNRSCPVRVVEAEDGMRAEPGLALVAPGDYHMILAVDPAGWRVQVREGPRVCYQRPSVDVLFNSVAAAAGREACGVILTGMGNDGAQGLLRMRQAGACTIAQDEASCVVFGMPRAAILAGAVERTLPLNRIAAAISAMGRAGSAAELSAAPGRRPAGSCRA